MNTFGTHVCLVTSDPKVVHFYRPKRSFGQGNVFTGVCLSTGGGGGRVSASVHAGMPYPPGTWQTPPRTWQNPPRIRHHPPRPGRPPRIRHHPTGSDTTTTPPDLADPPPREADSSIRSTSGRYASYWNAFLLYIKIT